MKCRISPDAYDIYSTGPIQQTLRFFSDVLARLLLPPDVGGPSTGVPGRETGPLSQHLHAGEDLEARHVLLQRQREPSAHHHRAKQVRPAVPGRPCALLVQVFGSRR